MKRQIHIVANVTLPTQLNSLPALALNLLKGILERSKIFFNRFRTSAKNIYQSNQLNSIYRATLILSILCSTLYATENFDIVLKSKWQDLCSNNKCVDFGGKWILVGSITFKKRSKEPISIDEINLKWHGEKIDNLIASLYRKTFSKEFLAIEDNLVCDGLWNPKTQTLILDFDEEEKLGPTTVFYLVLTIPESIEPILKKGHFCLENNCLPRPFKQCSQNEKLILAINETPALITTH